MVMTLVVLTFVVFIALDYFVFSKRRVEAHSAVRSVAAPALEPLPGMRQRLPDGVYLQPTFTWSRLGRLGEVFIGVHPMLTGLVGAACSFELRAAGERVAEGDLLVRIGAGERHLDVRSPIAGRVDEVNARVAGTAWSDTADDGGAWLYRIQPERVAEEVPRWLIGDQAADWTRRQYGLLRDYLHGAVTEGHLGTVMADGGELPVGILAGMDESVWAGLEHRFLTDIG